LTCFSARRTEAHAIHHVVETRFEQLQQVFTRVALQAVGFSEVTAELALENTIDTLHFLLFAQLRTVVGRTCTRRAAMLARLAVKLALVSERTTGALQEEVSAFTAGQLGLRADITCHVDSFCD
jgi:hypothetical protein